MWVRKSRRVLIVFDLSMGELTCLEQYLGGWDNDLFWSSLRDSRMDSSTYIYHLLPD